jgi:hypothetical protein
VGQKRLRFDGLQNKTQRKQLTEAQPSRLQTGASGTLALQSDSSQ